MHAFPIAQFYRPFRHLGLALTLACAWLAGGEALADVVITPAPGEAVRINGQVVLPAVPGATQQPQAVCISAAGQLGPCGASGNGGAYTAGTGLVLSPTGEFSIAPGYQLPQGCTSSQAIQWNGSAWVCVSPTGTGSLPACQMGEVLRFGAGGIECGAMPHGVAQVPGLLPQGMSDASYPAIAIGSDGLPVIAYHAYYDSQGRGELHLYKCADRACTSGRNHTLDFDSGGNVGTYNSIAIGADGLPVIAYRDNARHGLRVLKCGTVECSNATVTARTTVDAGNLGFHAGIAIDGDSMPVISYYNSSTEDLKLARCITPDCAGGTVITTLDSAGTVGSFSAIAVPADGLPIVSYFDASNGDLKIAKCNNANCTAPTLRTIDDAGTAGQYSRIAIGHDGLPVIAYQEGQGSDLAVIHCHDPSCAGTTRTIVDAEGNSGTQIGLAIGTSGPLISYKNTSLNLLKVAACHNAACTSATVSAVAAPFVGTTTTAVAVGTDGLPVITYHPGPGGPLKAVQCSTATCRKP